MSSSDQLREHVAYESIGNTHAHQRRKFATGFLAGCLSTAVLMLVVYYIITTQAHQDPGIRRTRSDDVEAYIAARYAEFSKESSHSLSCHDNFSVYYEQDQNSSRIPSTMISELVYPIKPLRHPVQHDERQLQSYDTFTDDGLPQEWHVGSSTDCVTATRFTFDHHGLTINDTNALYYLGNVSDSVCGTSSTLVAHERYWNPGCYKELESCAKRFTTFRARVQDTVALCQVREKSVSCYHSSSVMERNMHDLLEGETGLFGLGYFPTQPMICSYSTETTDNIRVSPRSWSERLHHARWQYLPAPTQILTTIRRRTSTNIILYNNNYMDTYDDDICKIAWTSAVGRARGLLITRTTCNNGTAV